MRTHRTKTKRFVLIKDLTAQDGAGAALLDPAFTHARRVDKALLARVVHEALQRCTPCVLYSWNRRFEPRLFHRFAQLPPVVAILRGSLREGLPRRADDDGRDRCYMTEMLWAVITVEVLDFLQYKRRDLPMLTWLVNLPTWLCENDSSRIEKEVDAVFEAWKAGRLCGKSLLRPCDSECCCHNAVGLTGCGCQCPCVCNCP